ncbi:MAG: hypothetical protein MJE68_21320 [Proteobacteria bacterium]|nr:hypothetical protein [Pseudomonadota bacterium]
MNTLNTLNTYNLNLKFVKFVNAVSQRLSAVTLGLALVFGLALTPNLASAQTALTLTADKTSVAQGGTVVYTLTAPSATTSDIAFVFSASGGIGSTTYPSATGSVTENGAVEDVTGRIFTGDSNANVTIVASSTSTAAISMTISAVSTGFTFSPSSISTTVTAGGGTTPPPVVMQDVRATINGSGTSTTYVVNEGDTVMANITLNETAIANVPVRIWTTLNGRTDDAIANREFTPFNRTVFVPAGEDNLIVPIRALENNVYHVGNISVLTITAAAPGQLLTASASIEITDNDAIPELVIEGPSRIAPGRNGTFTVRSLTSVIPGFLTVDVRANGSVARLYDSALPSAGVRTFNGNGSQHSPSFDELADSFRFNIEAAVPANASVEQDPIIVYLADSGFGDYNITHNRGSLVATAQVSPGGLNPVAVNEVVLPQAVMTVVDQVGQTIASRSQNSFGDDGYTRGFTINGETPLGFASTLATREAAREASENPWDSPDTLGGGSLSLTDLAADGELSLVLPLNRGEGGGSFTIWAEGFTRSLDGDQTGASGLVAFDGEVPGAVFGADARVGENLLAGIAVASATADFAYTTTDDAGTPLAGNHETELSSYHPYIGYRTEGGTNVWANFGVGEGEVTITEKGADANYVGEVETLSYAVGFTNLGDAREDGRAGLALNYHGDVSFASVEEAPTTRTRNSGAFEDATGSEISQTRARLGARLSHTRQHADGDGESRSSLGLAFRIDDGDTAEGGAVEIDGGLGVTLGDNLRLDLRGRTLLFHEEAVDDWGVSGGFVWRGNPTGAGRGLAVAVTPEWGNTVSRADALLGDGFGFGTGYGVGAGSSGDGSGSGSADGKARYGFDVRYGLSVLGDDLLVPYVRGDAGDGASAVYGGAYSFGGFATGVEVDAVGEDNNAFVRYSRDF